MPQIELHFRAKAGQATPELLSTLQQQLVVVDGVESVDASSGSRTSIPDAIQDVVILLEVSATVLIAGADALNALRKFIDAAKGLAESLGLTHPEVRVGMERLVPVDKLTTAEAETVMALPAAGARVAPDATKSTP